MSERRALIKAMSERYRIAGKKEKGAILDELAALTGYNRWYAVGLLRGEGQVIRMGKMRLVGDLNRKTKRTKPRIYDKAVHERLKEIWSIMVSSAANGWPRSCPRLSRFWSGTTRSN